MGLKKKKRTEGRRPAVECKKCKTWYSPDGPKAEFHERKKCGKLRGKSDE